jgi:outer membrane protein OmpA-like peptidoglycan-associated protein
MLHIGAFGGVFMPTARHGLFDPGEGERPTLAALGAAIGGRLEYYPLRFLGVGVEGGGTPIRSPSAGATTGAFGVRAHVIGQLPYRLSPFLLIGGGGLGNSSQVAVLNSSRGAFHWGGGLRVFVHKWIALRLDGRHVVAGTGTSRFSVGEVTLGLDVTLRLRDWAGPRKPRERDADEDGVVDSEDPCPATPGSDGHGCPAQLRDTDEDGIKDHADRCPRQWADTPGGCPVADQDGDSIPDARDSCIDEPETFNGWEDQNGCADEVPAEVAAFSGTIGGITFESNEATIRKSSYKVLDRAAATMRSYATMKIEIVGHTDSQGQREANIQLSQRRADAVKRYLVKQGVEEDRIFTRGAGPDEPVADNATKGGRAKNRRIEFRLVGG